MFFMRLSKQDKINIYQLYQQNYRYSEIKEYYPIEEGNFYYLIRVLNRYGISWLDRPRHKWTKEEKMEAIDRVLINHETRISVALDLGLSSTGRPRKKIITKRKKQRKIRLKQKIRESKNLRMNYYT